MEKETPEQHALRIKLRNLFGRRLSGVDSRLMALATHLSFPIWLKGVCAVENLPRYSKALRRSHNVEIKLAGEIGEFDRRALQCAEQIDWIIASLRGGWKWSYNGANALFELESDAALFRLRFEGEVVD